MPWGKGSHAGRSASKQQARKGSLYVSYERRSFEYVQGTNHNGGMPQRAGVQRVGVGVGNSSYSGLDGEWD